MLTEWLITRKKGKKFWRLLSKVFRHCEVHPLCEIPKSIRLGHGGHGIVIGNVKIGENVLIMHNVTLGEDFTKYKNKKRKESSLIIESGVVIGTGSIILGDIRIGKDSIIGAGSLVTKDVPSNTIFYNKRENIVKKRIQDKTKIFL